MEILHGLVGVVLGFLKNGSGLFPGFPQNLFFLFIQALLLFLQGVSERTDLFFVTGGLRLVFFQCDPSPLQLGDHVFKILILDVDLFFGVFDQEVRKPQLGRDGKGIALAGDTDQQTVCGAQGFHVKLTAGVFHAFGGERIDLQLAVMGGSHGADALTVQVIQDGDGQRGALRGIGAGAQLVKEYQRVQRGVL